MAAFSAVYIALFVWLDLTVSARCQRSATSLLLLLFVWTVVVVLVPNTLGSIAAGIEKIPSGVKDTDRNDPESPHVYLVKEGLSSKPVDVRDIPPFTDRLTFSHAVAQMALDAAILLSLCVLLFVCAYFSFLRYDAR